MGKLIWEGWYTSECEISEPTGPFIKRDGTKVLTLKRGRIENYKATPELQSAFACMGDELIVSFSPKKRGRP